MGINCYRPRTTDHRRHILNLSYYLMKEIRVHTEKKCRKMLHLESDLSLTIQMWYDRIHAYLQLIRMKEGHTRNAGGGNILQFACRQRIKHPEALTMEELKDGLQFACIRKAELRKQSKNNKINNICPMTSLHKHWMRLR